MTSADNFKQKTLTVEYVCNMLEGVLLQKKTFLAYRRPGGLNLATYVKGNDCRIFEGSEAQRFLKSVARKMYDNAEKHGESFCLKYKNPEFMSLSASNSKSVRDTLLLSESFTPKTPIKTFAFKSDPSLAFCRLPFDPMPTEQATPTWDIFMDNFSNGDAVKMWVGSVFFEESDRSQYLWFYGKGGNGKSTLSDIFKETLGSFARSEISPSTPSEKQYWTYGLIGKRLITIDECSQAGFVTEGMFKACTGSMSVRVERKNEPAYDTTLDCKFLFTSNATPEVSQDAADQRRLIFTSAKNITPFPFDPTFKPRLRAEFGAFVSNCMLLYKAVCPDCGPIPTDNKEALFLGNNYYEEVDAWFNEIFEIDAQSCTKVYDFNEARLRTRLDKGLIYKYMQHMGFAKDRAYIGGETVRVFRGFKPKIRAYGG